MMKQKIKIYLKKNKYVRAALIFRNAYQEPEYYRQCLGHKFFNFQEYGPLNSGKILYVINELRRGSGFFFSWWMTCRGLMVAERFGFTPVVDWSNGAYFDETGMNGCMNPFEYFFEPVSSVSLDEAMQSRNVTFMSHHTDGEAFSMYSHYDDELINRFVRINTKYLHIKDELYNQIRKEIQDLLRKKRTIAVHVRGVDWGNVKNHPIPASLESYVQGIDSAFQKYEYDQIFLATDSEDTVTFFRQRYQGKVFIYDDVMRAKKGSTVLAILDGNIKRENNGFLLGREVLRDMLTLSFCEGLVAGLSFVSFAADVFKRGRGETYLSKEFVGQEVCKKGVAPEELGDRFQGR